jgi:Spy/CpxP family protein refolding chaperone
VNQTAADKKAINESGTGTLNGGVFMNWKWFVAAPLFFCAAVASAAETSSPYLGQENREIKALSREEINGYLSGDGMGFAKAAELNHYPGPKHVLQLADQLQLSEEQRTTTGRIFQQMNVQAVSLGKQLVEMERLLDSHFAGASISTSELQRLVMEISSLQGKIRATHLQAHLAQKAILRPEQLIRYDSLRGYDTAGTHGQHVGH